MEAVQVRCMVCPVGLNPHLFVGDSFDLALQHVGKGCLEGCAHCCHLLGKAYIEAAPPRQRCELGLNLLQASAATCYAPAMLMMGYLYCAGKLVPRDYIKAIEYLKPVSEVNRIDTAGPAEFWLSWAYNQLDTDKTDWPLISAHLYRAADLGCPSAQMVVVHHYLTGTRVSVDNPRAVALLNTMVACGSGWAHAKLGVLYDEGTGVPVDARKAATHFVMAIDKGITEAYYHLGRMYFTGRPCFPQDHAKALDTFRMGYSKKRCQRCCTMVGVMTQLGYGCPVDIPAGNRLLDSVFGGPSLIDVAPGEGNPRASFLSPLNALAGHPDASNILAAADLCLLANKRPASPIDQTTKRHCPKTGL